MRWLVVTSVASGAVALRRPYADVKIPHVLSCDDDPDWRRFRELAWENHEAGYPINEDLETFAMNLIEVKQRPWDEHLALLDGFALDPNVLEG